MISTLHPKDRGHQQNTSRAGKCAVFGYHYLYVFVLKCFFPDRAPFVAIDGLHLLPYKAHQERGCSDFRQLVLFIATPTQATRNAFRAGRSRTKAVKP
jgi:hypothetical protein